MRAASRARAFALALVLPLGACASLPSWVPGSRAAPKELEASEVPRAIERAEQDLAADRTESALNWMRAASGARNLPTEQRERVQQLLEAAARRRIEELSAPGQEPEELADLTDLGLPRQLAVQAGLAGARRWLEAGEEMEAFRLLRKLDKKFPLHHEHVAAGGLLVEIGMALAELHRSFLFFYDTDDQAAEVLEYVVLNHPSNRRDDEAYRRLAELYERDGELDLSIERLERLVLDHPDSPLRPAAQARIPRLRLQLLRSPEYDRGTLLEAEDELKRWLRMFPDHDLAASVAIDLGDCMRRLCDSDLAIAGFYETVEKSFPARFHARRAAEEAREAGDAAREARANALLASLPPEDPARPHPREGTP